MMSLSFAAGRCLRVVPNVGDCVQVVPAAAGGVSIFLNLPELHASRPGWVHRAQSAHFRERILRPDL